jgi:hypothetical protein
MNNKWYLRKIDGTLKPYDLNAPNKYAFYSVLCLLICLILGVICVVI